jgi:hypothetical protein
MTWCGPGGELADSQLTLGDGVTGGSVTRGSGAVGGSAVGGSAGEGEIMAGTVTDDQAE